MATNLQQLAEQLTGVSGVSLTTGQGGLPCLDVSTPMCRGQVYLHGAHVAAFQPADHQPVLWLSQHSRFADGQPIRGGIPICFPWFGPKAEDPQAPAHGLARTHVWQLLRTPQAADQSLELTLQADIDGWSVHYTLDFARALTLKLSVRLPENAPAPRRFEAALHTYFSVGDVRRVTVRGLESAAYIDKVDGGQCKSATGQPIAVEEECDRVYLDTTATCVLVDPVLEREIHVSKEGSRNTVVWNPWIAKSARMPDFGDQEWPGMLCIETANVGEAAVELQPGQSHTLQAAIQVSSLS